VSASRGYRAVARSGPADPPPRARLNQHLAPDVSSTAVWTRNSPRSGRARLRRRVRRAGDL